MRRQDLSFSTAETAFLRLPRETRRVRIAAPDSAAMFTLTFLADVVPDGSSDPEGRTVTEWLGANGRVVNVAGGAWGAIPEPRAHLDDYGISLAFNWDAADVTQPITALAAGDYLILAQREGIVWDAANPVLQRIQYGRFMLRNALAYETDEDYLEALIQRLRDAIEGGEGKGAQSVGLLEVETPDGRREKYAGIGALMTQLRICENRLSYLRASDGGRHPITGWRLEAY